MIEMMGILGTREIGSRYATRVRVVSPQGSAFAGQAGIVVRVYHRGAILVRLESGLSVCFGREELEVRRG